MTVERYRQIRAIDEIVSVETDQGRIALRIRVENIDIEKLRGFESRRFVDHTMVGVEAGPGLCGGGDATAMRELRFDVESLPEAQLALNLDVVVGNGRVKLGALNSFLNHNELTNCKPTEHVDHTKVEVGPGVGLSGGGTIEQSVVLRLALQKLERVAPTLDEMWIPVVDAEGIHGRIAVSALKELFELTKGNSDALAA